MTTPDRLLPLDEDARLDELYRLRILDTPAESGFEAIARAAAALLGAPLAGVGFLDRDRQWFKALQGLPVREIPREHAICARAILQPGPLVVPDLLADPRFAASPFVAGEPHLRFYAGVPVRVAGGRPIGTIAVWDRQARALDEVGVRALAELGRVVEAMLEARARELDVAARLDQSHRAGAETSLLQAVAAAVVEAPDLEAALRVTLRRTCEASGWICGEAWVPGPEGKLVRTDAWHAAEPGLEDFGRESRKYSFVAGAGLPGQAWLTRAAAWSRDVTEDPLYLRREEAQRSGLRTAVAVPILARGEPQAVLVFYLRQVLEADAQMAEVIAGVAAQLGEFLRRKALETSLAQERDDLAARRAVLAALLKRDAPDQFLPETVGILARRVGAEVAAVLIAQRGKLVTVWSQGFAGELAVLGVPVPVAQAPDWLRRETTVTEPLALAGVMPASAKAEGMQSWASFPLDCRDDRGGDQSEPLGVVLFAARRQKAFDVQALGLLRDAAGEIAIALDRAQARATARTRFERLDTLREIDHGIIQRRKLPEILQIVLRQIPAALGADAVAISLLDDTNTHTRVFLMRLPNGTWVEDTAFTLADALLSEYVERQVPVIIDDLARDSRLASHRPVLAARGLTSYLGAPLIVGGRTIGVLHALSVLHREFDREDVGFFQTLAGQAAIAISHARATETLQERHELLKSVIEGVEDAIFVKDVQGKYCLINPAVCRNAGRPAEEILGRDDRDIVEPAVAERAMASDRELIRTGQSTRYEIEVSARAGTRLLQVSKSPLRNASGTVTGVIGIARDLTEMRRVERDLRQSQKMESLGRLAGGVAHDFNNLLTAILGYADLALHAEGLSPLVTECLQEVTKASQRAAGMTRQLLTLSRKQASQSVRLDLGHAVDDFVGTLRRLVPENVSLEVRSQPDLPAVLADPGQIQQVILNLVVNAGDAMPGGGTLGVETRTHRSMGANGDGGEIALVVTDTGTGMDEETRSHLFEPFYTTKEGKGTGLGLSMVYSIVQGCGGRIEVESALGQGTTFRVILPAVSGPPDTAPSESHPKESARGGETVLLVEDEENVRNIIRVTLADLGYRVLVAGNTEAALAVAAEEHETIHLLMSDIVLGGPNDGLMLAETMMQRRPGIRVLLMSGYAKNLNKAAAAYPFLAKPFTRSDIAQRVREALDRAPRR